MYAWWKKKRLELPVYWNSFSLNMSKICQGFVRSGADQRPLVSKDALGLANFFTNLFITCIRNLWIFWEWIFSFVSGEKTEIFIFITNCVIVVKLTIPIDNILFKILWLTIQFNELINNSKILVSKESYVFNASMAQISCRMWKTCILWIHHIMLINVLLQSLYTDIKNYRYTRK